MLKIILEGLIPTAHVFKGLKLQIIYWATLPKLPIMILLSTLTVITGFQPLKHFICRMRFSETAHQDQMYHQQCLSFLMADKCLAEQFFLPEHRNVNHLDRGGLEKVNENVIDIFSDAEAYFSLNLKTRTTMNV